MTETRDDKSLGSVLGRVRSNWGWFVAAGAILVALGIYVLGNLFAATVASIFIVGILMIAGGITHIVLSFRGRTWRHFLIWLLGGVLYAIAGAFVISDPILASALLTLMFAFVLMASGAVRIWLGWAARPESGWGWLVAAGLVTLAAGIFVVASWPISALWAIGVVLAVDLLFQGLGYISFGLALRARS